MPELFVITGPNGAGKSVLGSGLLPDSANLDVFDGDKTFYQFLDEFYQELRVSKYAKEKAGEKLELTFNRLVEDAISAKADFAYEGHFGSATSWRVVEQLRSLGYRTNFIFCFTAERRIVFAACRDESSSEWALCFSYSCTREFLWKSRNA